MSARKKTADPAARRLMVHPWVEAASMHTLKPFDAAYLAARAGLGKPILTVEENCCLGGLGSVVASALAKRRRPTPFDAPALEDRFPVVCGSRPIHQEAFPGTRSSMIARTLMP